MSGFSAAGGIGIGLGLSLVLGAITAAAPLPSGGEEAPFLVENQDAMAKMMTGMAVQPSGDVDRDFALMMIAHHQGAIDMAKAELHHGRNELLRRLAQGIIVEQQAEIAAMTLTLDSSPPPSTSMPRMNMHKEP